MLRLMLTITTNLVINTCTRIRSRDCLSVARTAVSLEIRNFYQNTEIVTLLDNLGKIPLTIQLMNVRMQV